MSVLLHRFVRNFLCLGLVLILYGLSDCSSCGFFDLNFFFLLGDFGWRSVLIFLTCMLKICGYAFFN